MNPHAKATVDSPAGPVTAGNEVYAIGLTKLEWAAVHMMAANRAADGDTSSFGLAAMAVADARALFAELEKQG